MPLRMRYRSKTLAQKKSHTDRDWSTISPLIVAVFGVVIALAATDLTEIMRSGSVSAWTFCSMMMFTFTGIVLIIDNIITYQHLSCDAAGFAIDGFLATAYAFAQGGVSHLPLADANLDQSFFAQLRVVYFFYAAIFLLAGIRVWRERGWSNVVFASLFGLSFSAVALFCLHRSKAPTVDFNNFLPMYIGPILVFVYGIFRMTIWSTRNMLKHHARNLFQGRLASFFNH